MMIWEAMRIAAHMRHAALVVATQPISPVPIATRLAAHAQIVESFYNGGEVKQAINNKEMP